MPTFDVTNRFPRKTVAHNVLISKIKKVYKKDQMNVTELSRLTDIGYSRLRRLLFDDGVWTVEEWFAVLIVCDAMGAIPQVHRAVSKEMARYQKTARYQKKIPQLHRQT